MYADVDGDRIVVGGGLVDGLCDYLRSARQTGGGQSGSLSTAQTEKYLCHVTARRRPADQRPTPTPSTFRLHSSMLMINN